MVSIDDLLEEQAETFDLLKKFIENHHKTAENKVTIGYMQARLKLLDDYYQQFKAAHSSLRRGTNSDQRSKLDYFKKNTLECFLEMHLDTQTELNDVLLRLQTPAPAAPANVPRIDQPAPQGYGLKLPKVHIPKFSGNYENWTNFYDVFVSLVHNHATLSQVEKLHHLKSSLSGEAEQLLKHFTITEANYAPAWVLLTKRYQNSRLIINAHLKTLTSIPKLTQETASGLRQLLDTTTGALLALNNLEVPTDQWNAIIVFLTEQKMDSESLKSWEQSRVDPSQTPTFEELSKFLETRFRALEMVGSSNPLVKNQQRTLKTFHTSTELCIVCTGSHRIYECTKFLSMDRGLRRRFVDNNSLCANCLSQNHKTNTCKSRFKCRFCRKRHHSMLHDKTQSSSSESTTAAIQNQSSKDACNTPEASTSSQTVTLHNVSSEVISNSVLLATALVQVDSPTGTHTLRALVDPCSEASFISEEAVKQLGLPTKTLHTSVDGLGANTPQKSTSSVEFSIKSCQESHRSHHVTALIFPVITRHLPQQVFPSHTWNHLKHLPLADPTFAQPGKVDLLLGAKIYKHIILPGLLKGSPDEPVAQQTSLGWIVTGDDSSNYSETDISQFHSGIQAFHSCIDIDDNLKRFWELESVPTTVQKSDEDIRCEEFYDKTHRRESNGRYTVKLPFNTYQTSINQQASESCCTALGRSRFSALKRLYQVEKRLMRDSQLGKQSKLLMLNPFLDEFGILRVGGRIQKSNLPFNIKHPIILPSNHDFTKMVIKEAHLQTLHGGPQLTLSYVRRKFWILNARNTTRFTIHQCIRCHRFSTQTQQQIMGNLPSPRVTPSRPFCHSGVDYAGPINVRVSKGRGTKAYKGYLAIFVCLSTKAIHIELVSDMTTEAFIAAFRRFTSRRGLCSDMYSDCGTNFMGAGTKLSSDFEKSIHEVSKEVRELLASNGTHWHYIPPASPHFGGLREAGVKSTKHHLKRVIGDSTLTFEELYTVLTQIEACLNSRPLCPMTSDPTDLQVLTPGHFLVGDALVIPPEPSFLDKNGNTLTRWRLVQKMVQDFWNIWSNEYLSRLQQRPKWVNKHRNIGINELSTCN